MLSMRDCAAFILSGLTKYPLVDIVLAILWWWAVSAAWRLWTGLPGDRPATAQNVEERRLGVMVILGEIQYLIVGASVILAGVGAFAALAVNQHASDLVKYSIGWAAAWDVLALLGGVYAASLLPHYTLSQNFVLVPSLNKWMAIAVFALVAAAARLLVAVWLLLIG